MDKFTSSEILLYTGIVFLAAAVIFAVICFAIFILRSRRLKRVLEQEYGKPRR